MYFSVPSSMIQQAMKINIKEFSENHNNASCCINSMLKYTKFNKTLKLALLMRGMLPILLLIKSIC